MTSNLRVVIDTNVVLSASIWADSVPFKAVLAATRVGQVLLSLEVEEELKDVFQRKKFDKFIPADERLEFLECVRENQP